VDADLASLLAAPLPDAPLSLGIEAPLVDPIVFLRLPLPGEPLLWDASCWGDRSVAARGSVARWTPQYGDLASLAREAGSFLNSVEQRSVALDAPDALRCYGGVSFDPLPRGAAWAEFGAGSFVLPRFLYERGAGRALLRLRVLPGESLAPLLDTLQSARRHLASLGSAAPAPALQEVCLTEDAEHYRRVVTAALAAIHAGSFEKVVVARSLTLDGVSFDPWSALDRLGGEHLVRFAFGRGDGLFFGATPEQLVSFDGRFLQTEALAGSMAAFPGASDVLLASDKDRREHRVVVDAILQSLAPLCARLDAPQAPEIRALRHLLHLRTPIHGEVRGGLHALNLVGALHPTPAVCGLPREAAAAWLQEHEGLDRGWYAAPVGWFDARGRGAFAVALRSALLRGTSARLFVGAGLVRGSTPEGELRETALKARPLLEALGVRP
jgi:salicylate biosynthesis isochorismate synthase